MARLLAFLTLLVIGDSSFAKGNLSPLWINGDNECPAASALDHYIDVPVFHDLETIAKIDRIPGLNIFKDTQKEFSGKKLRVYYELFKPWDPSKKLLIVVPGGPGQTHADLHPLIDLFEKETQLLQNFNVIAMDHRGVGCSRPLFPGNEPEESMMMRQAASDIEFIRKELVGQDGKINVWGYSYGSILAQTYGLLFPDHLDRLFIGGTVSSPDDFHLAAVEFESFVYSGVAADVRQNFEQKLKDDTPLLQLFLDWAFNQLYSFQGRTIEIPKKVNEILKMISEGKRDQVVSNLIQKPEVTPWMKRSISCLELFPYTLKLPGENPIWERFMGVCSEFKGKHEYFNYLPLLHQIHVPTFIYGGAFDHVTPAKGMIAMARVIPESQIFIDNYMGHGFSGKVKCILNLTTDFFNGRSDLELRNLMYSPVCQDPPEVTGN